MAIDDTVNAWDDDIQGQVLCVTRYNYWKDFKNICNIVDKEVQEFINKNKEVPGYSNTPRGIQKSIEEEEKEDAFNLYGIGTIQDPSKKQSLSLDDIHSKQQEICMPSRLLLSSFRSTILYKARRRCLSQLSWPKAGSYTSSFLPRFFLWCTFNSLRSHPPRIHNIWKSNWRSILERFYKSFRRITKHYWVGVLLPSVDFILWIKMYLLSFCFYS